MQRGDLQIDYTFDGIINDGPSIGGRIILKDFQNGQFHIRLPSDSYVTASPNNIYYDVGSNVDERINCRTNSASKLYGFSGEDNYNFYIGNTYNCTLNGFPYGNKTFVANKLDGDPGAYTTINGFKTGDHIDLSNTRASIDDIRYFIKGDSTFLEVFESPIHIPHAIREVLITLDGENYIHPYDLFPNVTLPDIEFDYSLLDISNPEPSEAPCPDEISNDISTAGWVGISVSAFVVGIAIPVIMQCIGKNGGSGHVPLTSVFE